MGVYLSVRGWLDCQDEQLEAIQEVIRRHDDGFYSGGWSTARGPNGALCVVYCGTIRESGAEWLLAQLREAAVIPPPADPEDTVRGLFLVHHDESGMQEWQVRDGKVLVEPLPGRYDYLQA